MGTVVLYLQLFCKSKVILGLPWWLSGKESACQCRRCWRWVFDPWVGKIPWSRKWQPTPVFLPGESHGQKSPVGYSPWGRRVGPHAEHNTACCMKHNTVQYLSPVTLLVRVNPHITGIQFCVVRKNPSFQKKAKSLKAILLNKHVFHDFVVPSHNMTIFLIVSMILI